MQLRTEEIFAQLEGCADLENSVPRERRASRAGRTDCAEVAEVIVWLATGRRPAMSWPNGSTFPVVLIGIE